MQRAVQVAKDDLAAVVVARPHQEEGGTAGQREGIGHHVAHD